MPPLSVLIPVLCYLILTLIPSPGFADLSGATGAQTLQARTFVDNLSENGKCFFGLAGMEIATSDGNRVFADPHQEARRRAKEKGTTVEHEREMLDLEDTLRQLGEMMFSTPLPPIKISDVEYRDIRHTALEVTKDPSTFVLGFGQSPTPFTAFLQKLRPGSARNVPLSSFKPTPEATPGSATGRAPLSEAALKRAPLTSDQRDRLYELFDQFVPNDKDLAGRKIILLDYVEGGETIQAIYSHFKDYLKARERTVDFEVVGLVAPGKKTLFETAGSFPGLPIRLVEMSEPLGADLFKRTYKKYSEYGKYDVRNLDAPIPLPEESRSGYREFSRVLADKMAEDPTLTLPPH